MTVGEKMHQTLASLESAAANLKSFSLDTQDQTAKQMFASYSQQLEDICKGLRGRVNYIEQQEPQYKVLQQRQQQNQQ
ncbi:DUF1657 domain-containing protein [Desulfofundulus thermocisternus]|uniref:DUF1657 domain-containing protein n=1 Tax=Desulfofundulus thermocisternus TaxID=42471 RepID=UPI0019FE0FE0|nr:DUF1657 domain-containing protein [Desulfofundulus thermocisternus]MBE3585771.1 DUF1657 domain-containing protein [Thermoanaerobacter sp.]MCS5696358.1 DUF1657 domain-containing protein [Desulfofundulus thermocisternus]